MPKPPKGLFGALFSAPFALPMEMASAISSVDRKYAVNLKGFHGSLSFKLDVNSRKIKILQAHFNSLEFDRRNRRIELLNRQDGIGAALLNEVFGGGVDKLIEEMIIKQMHQPSFLQRFTLPLKEFLESHLSVPGEVRFSNALDIRSNVEINGTTTNHNLFSSTWSVSMNVPKQSLVPNDLPEKAPTPL